MNKLAISDVLISNVISLKKLKVMLERYLCPDTFISDEEWVQIKKNKLILESISYNVDDLQTTIDSTNKTALRYLREWNTEGNTIVN